MRVLPHCSVEDTVSVFLASVTGLFITRPGLLAKICGTFVHHSSFLAHRKTLAGSTEFLQLYLSTRTHGGIYYKSLCIYKYIYRLHHTYSYVHKYTLAVNVWDKRKAIRNIRLTLFAEGYLHQIRKYIPTRDKPIYISLGADSFEKGMNPSLLFQL